MVNMGFLQVWDNLASLCSHAQSPFLSPMFRDSPSVTIDDIRFNHSSHGKTLPAIALKQLKYSNDLPYVSGLPFEHRIEHASEFLNPNSKFFMSL